MNNLFLKFKEIKTLVPLIFSCILIALDITLYCDDDKDRDIYFSLYPTQFNIITSFNQSIQTTQNHNESYSFLTPQNSQ